MPAAIPRTQIWSRVHPSACCWAARSAQMLCRDAVIWLSTCSMLMRQGHVGAQVLSHNAVHAAFAGFTGVTVRARGTALALEQLRV